MVRTANSCSHCTTVMGEYAFINTLMGPSVLLLHSEIGSVLWFEPKCNSWAIPVCHASALNTSPGSALVFDATPPWINHGPFSSVYAHSSPANSEEAGMSLEKVDYILPGILGNTDQFSIFNTQTVKYLAQVPSPCCDLPWDKVRAYYMLCWSAFFVLFFFFF